MSNSDGANLCVVDKTSGSEYGPVILISKTHPMFRKALQ